jgi:hypothetical protein
MSQHQTRLERDVYDHEDEQVAPSGRRRGPVADWGVGEELFDQMPRRRFRGEEHARPGRERRAGEPADGAEVPRGRVDDGRRTLQIGSDEDVPSEIAAVTADRDIDDGEAPAPPVGEAAAPVDRDETLGEPAAPADRDVTRGEPRTARAEERFATRAADELDAGTAAARVAPRDPSRRTVKIDGRPDGSPSQARFYDGPRRGRARRSVGDHVGARPDRLAAWAFALGVLLILIAVLSSVL